MLLNSLLPTVGSFRIGKSNLVRSTSELSKNEPDEIGTFPSGNEEKKQPGYALYYCEVSLWFGL